MKSFIPFLLGILLLLAACDRRGEEEPSLSVTASAYDIYNVDNHNVVYVECQLRGLKDQIQDQIIDVIYDGERGVFRGTGNANYLRTDQEGRCSGEFIAADHIIGDVVLKFEPEHYAGQSHSITLHVYDMPKIAHVSAEPDTISTSGANTSDISLTVESQSNNVAQQWVRFECFDGTLASDSVRTNNDGYASNTYHAGTSTSGDVTISTWLSIYPEDKKYIRIHVIR